MPVKEILKWVNIWWRYDYDVWCFLFRLTAYYRHMSRVNKRHTFDNETITIMSVFPWLHAIPARVRRMMFIVSFNTRTGWTPKTMRRTCTHLTWQQVTVSFSAGSTSSHVTTPQSDYVSTRTTSQSGTGPTRGLSGWEFYMETRSSSCLANRSNIERISRTATEHSADKWSITGVTSPRPGQTRSSTFTSVGY